MAVAGERRFMVKGAVDVEVGEFWALNLSLDGYIPRFSACVNGFGVVSA